MAGLAYTTARHVPATDAQGRDCAICVAIVRHENGHTDRVAIREDWLRYTSGGDPVREADVIENEIRVATSR